MFEAKFEGYKLASTWAEYQDKLAQGQIVFITNFLEVNEHSTQSPMPNTWEFKPKNLGDFLEKALSVLSTRAFEVNQLQEALENAKTRIALRNRQIRELRRQLRK